MLNQLNMLRNKFRLGFHDYKIFNGTASSFQSSLPPVAEKVAELVLRRTSR
jgi:hypothetical protein